jgi:hypothetical protein
MIYNCMLGSQYQRSHQPDDAAHLPMWAWLLLRISRQGALLFLLLGTATAGASQTAHPRVAQPLKALPDAWLHLPEFCSDCWTGAYHDRESGAYVRYSIFSGRVPAQSKPEWEKTARRHSARTTRGTLQGVRYATATYASARAVVSRQLEELAGEPADQLIDAIRRTIPPDGCGLLSIVFYPGKEGWRFDATICDALQEKRVRQLLLEKRRLNQGGAGKIEHSTAISVTTYSAIATGETCEALMRAIGRPEASYQASREGFALLYWVKSPGTEQNLREARLFFDRSQQLVRKEVEAARPRDPDIAPSP